MIKHVVMFKFKDNAEGNPKADNVKIVMDMLGELPHKIKQIKEYEIGKSFINSQRASDLVLISAFDSVEDLDKYRIHHEHVKAVDFITKVVESSTVVDFETE